YPPVEGMGDVDQARETHTVIATLVFLDLLERDTDGLGQAGLRHLQRHPPLTNVLTDRNVKFVRQVIPSRCGRPIHGRLIPDPRFTVCRWNQERVGRQLDDASRRGYLFE